MTVGRFTGVIGLLWYDPDASRDWRDRMQAAIQRHQERFGLQPTLCFINPLMIDRLRVGQQPEYLETVGEADVFLSNAIQPGHFFVARRPAPNPAPTPQPPATQLGLGV